MAIIQVMPINNMVLWATTDYRQGGLCNWGDILSEAGVETSVTLKVGWKGEKGLIPFPQDDVNPYKSLDDLEKYSYTHLLRGLVKGKTLLSLNTLASLLSKMLHRTAQEKTVRNAISFYTTLDLKSNGVMVRKNCAAFITALEKLL